MRLIFRGRVVLLAAYASRLENRDVALTTANMSLLRAVDPVLTWASRVVAY